MFHESVITGGVVDKKRGFAYSGGIVTAVNYRINAISCYLGHETRFL